MMISIKNPNYPYITVNFQLESFVKLNFVLIIKII